jgi:NADPH2:quinone reductase
MRAFQFTDSGPVSNLRLIELPDPKANRTTAVAKVATGAISPSDVKNVQGKMEYATVPRVSGRDYAGTAFRGPAEWVGREVWGTGGEIAYTSDGSDAELIAVPIASLRRKPTSLSLDQAEAIGLTYLAAWLGVMECAQLAAGETLLVTAAGGGVGSVDRNELPPGSPAEAALDDFVVLGEEPLEAVVRRTTSGRGAEVVFDAVGGSTFEPALKSLAHGGRQTDITSVGNRQVSFDLLDFYHNESIRVTATRSLRRRCSRRSPRFSSRARSSLRGSTASFPSRRDAPVTIRSPEAK